MKNNCHDICKNNISSLSWEHLQVYSDVPSRTVTDISANTSFASTWFNPSSQPLLEVYKKMAAHLPPCFQIITENPSFCLTSPWGKFDTVQILKSYLVHGTGAWSLNKSSLPWSPLLSPLLSHQHASQLSTHSSSLPFSDIKIISLTSEMKIDGFYLMVSPSLQWLIAVPLLFQSLHIFPALPWPPHIPPSFWEL